MTVPARLELATVRGTGTQPGMVIPMSWSRGTEPRLHGGRGVVADLGGELSQRSRPAGWGRAGAVGPAACLDPHAHAGDAETDVRDAVQRVLGAGPRAALAGDAARRAFEQRRHELGPLRDRLQVDDRPTGRDAGRSQ